MANVMRKKSLMIYPALKLRLIAAMVLVGIVSRTAAETLSVGPSQHYLRIEDALANARPDDVILVYPQPDNRPYEAVALALNQPRITIQSASPKGVRIPLSGKGYDYSGRGQVPRAIAQFNKGADGCVLDGFVLSDAHNESHNGAGVRINQANNITIRNCSIHSNDMGIMSNGDGTPDTAVNQLIENSAIYSNGDPSEPGQNHNLYLGGTSVTVRGCEIHSSLTGHNVKSRAHHTSVIACYVHDSANREFDLVDGKSDTATAGSDAILAGNIIVKARPCSGNRAVIHFGQDGGNEHNGTLFLLHNTIVTSYISPVVQLSAPQARATMQNNIVWDGGTPQSGQVLFALTAGVRDANRVTGSCNWLAAGFRSRDLGAFSLSSTYFGASGDTLGFAEAQKGDYRLLKPDLALVDKGNVLSDEVTRAIRSTLFQYRPPQGYEPRHFRGKPDLGAYECANDK